MTLRGKLLGALLRVLAGIGLGHRASGGDGSPVRKVRLRHRTVGGSGGPQVGAGGGVLATRWMSLGRASESVVLATVLSTTRRSRGNVSLRHRMVGGVGGRSRGNVGRGPPFAPGSWRTFARTVSCLIGVPSGTCGTGPPASQSVKVARFLRTDTAPAAPQPAGGKEQAGAPDFLRQVTAPAAPQPAGESQWPGAPARLRGQTERSRNKSREKSSSRSAAGWSFLDALRRGLHGPACRRGTPRRL